MPLHIHDWRIVAMEEDGFGFVRMLQCPCGAVEYRSARGSI
ncbi:MAG: hypothetical protein ACTHJM_06105 [Marmoricola sp.]